jgi:SAM-dependent methyltransferase
LTVAKNTPAIALGADDVIPRDHCPVCAGGDLVAYEKLTFREITIPYQRCRACDLVFMNPVPNQAWYDRLYGQAFWETKSAKAAEAEHLARQKQLIKELQRTEKLCATLDAMGCAPPRGGRILEIGCAFGLIISTIADHYQTQAFGVEPSELAAGFAKTLCGVKILAPTIEKLNEAGPRSNVQSDDQSGGQMDLILFSHVMENVVDLNIVFQVIEKWLAPGGVVLMETPNSTVQNSTHIYHPYCFSRTSLRRLYGKHGFEIISLRASGRPSSALIPRYLTLVARRRNTTGTAANTAANTATGANINGGLDRRIGHGWRQTIKRTPLKYLDRILTRILYAPDRAARLRAAELARAHGNESGNEGKLSGGNGGGRGVDGQAHH